MVERGNTNKILVKKKKVQYLVKVTRLLLVKKKYSIFIPPLGEKLFIIRDEKVKNKLRNSRIIIFSNYC